MNINIYAHPSCLRHDTGPGHPERIARLEALLRLFDDMNLETMPAREAEMEELLRVHPQTYIDKVQDAIPEDGYACLDSDTVVSPGSWDAALHAAGAVCRAVDDVLSGKCTRAFCAVRPPGHHAFPDHPEGFCIFNNIAVGALHALNHPPLPILPPQGGGGGQGRGGRRVAIADFDVHHGNGTDAIARKHDGIFFASTHQWPFYPGTGLPEDDIAGRIVNRPLPANGGAAEFRAAWKEILEHMDAFRPELVFISAGFDAHRDDPLAQINLTEDDYAWITGELVKLADKHCGGKIVSALEGGYDLTALKNSVAAHLRTIMSS